MTQVVRVLLASPAMFFLGCGGDVTNVKSAPSTDPASTTVSTPNPKGNAKGERVVVDPETAKKRVDSTEERIGELQGLTDEERKKMLEEHRKANGS